MFDKISPLYIMKLIDKVESALWNEFNKAKYQNIKNYIEKWHEVYDDGPFPNSYSENFVIYFQDEEENNIDLDKTLQRMPNEIVLRIAVDLGLPTPGFLPVVTEKFNNILSSANQNASNDFTRAIQNTYENPDEAITLATSALDGLLKTIIKSINTNEKIGNNLKKRTGYLAKIIIEQYNGQCPQEIQILCNQLRSIVNSATEIRNNKATAHGKSEEEYPINDPILAALIINSCSTLGIFLWNLFNKAKQEEEVVTHIEDPLDIQEIPF